MHDLQIGDAAPDFALPGIDGKVPRLAEHKSGRVLMIFFTSNHYPTSHGAEARVKKLLADFRGKGLTFVAINPNHPNGLSIDELGYSKNNDGFEDMKKYADEHGFDSLISATARRNPLSDLNRKTHKPLVVKDRKADAEPPVSCYGHQPHSWPISAYLWVCERHNPVAACNHYW